MPADMTCLQNGIIPVYVHIFFFCELRWLYLRLQDAIWSHGKQEALDSRHGQASFFINPYEIWWLSVGPFSGCE